jgi:hypothetical protein
MKLDREGIAPYDHYKDADARFFQEMKDIKEKVIDLIRSSSRVS